VNVSRVRPGGQLSHGSKLLEETAHNPFAVCVGAQAIQLGHHERERPLQFADGVFRIELALLIETALALLELFAIEVGVIGEEKDTGMPGRTEGASRSGSETSGSVTPAYIGLF